MMRGRGYGRIINLASMMSHVSLPGRTAYSASKAAMLGVTRALAQELADDGITVVAISPGPFATEINTALIENPELNRQFLSNIPLGRWGKAEEIGKLALYLCSDAAGFITGSDVVIDGGWTSR
jgi:NAD(P)-dependent dehydrogenase (short-subunit alcohol dehydrogenase family)